MNRILALTALLLGVTVNTADADTLSHKEVRNLFPGRYVVNVMGTYEVRVNMRANGLVTGTAAGERDTGRWSIESGKLCIAWSTWNNGRKDCSVLQRDGNRVKGRGFWFTAA